MNFLRRCTSNIRPLFSVGHISYHIALPRSHVYQERLEPIKYVILKFPEQDFDHNNLASFLANKRFPLWIQHVISETVIIFNVDEDYCRKLLPLAWLTEVKTGIITTQKLDDYLSNSNPSVHDERRLFLDMICQCILKSFGSFEACQAIGNYTWLLSANDLPLIVNITFKATSTGNVISITQVANSSLCSLKNVEPERQLNRHCMILPMMISCKVLWIGKPDPNNDAWVDSAWTSIERKYPFVKSHALRQTCDQWVDCRYISGTTRFTLYWPDCLCASVVSTSAKQSFDPTKYQDPVKLAMNWAAAVDFDTTDAIMKLVKDHDNDHVEISQTLVFNAPQDQADSVSIYPTPPDGILGQSTIMEVDEDPPQDSFTREISNNSPTDPHSSLSSKMNGKQANPIRTSQAPASLEKDNRTTNVLEFIHAGQKLDKIPGFLADTGVHGEVNTGGDRNPISDASDIIPVCNSFHMQRKHLYDNSLVTHPQELARHHTTTDTVDAISHIKRNVRTTNLFESPALFGHVEFDQDFGKMGEKYGSRGMYDGSAPERKPFSSNDITLPGNKHGTRKTSILSKGFDHDSRCSSEELEASENVLKTIPLSEPAIDHSHTSLDNGHSGRTLAGQSWLQREFVKLLVDLETRQRLWSNISQTYPLHTMPASDSNAVTTNWWTSFEFSGSDTLEVAQLISKTSMFIILQGEASDEAGLQEAGAYMKMTESASKPLGDLTHARAVSMNGLAQLCGKHKDNNATAHLFALAPPFIRVRKQSHDWDMLPSATNFWQALDLMPVHGTKHVSAWSLCIGSQELKQVCQEFLVELGATYTSCNLGQFKVNDMCYDEEKESFADYVMEMLYIMTVINQSITGKTDASAPYLLYVFDTLDKPENIKFLCACYRHIFGSLVDSGSMIFLQIIPLHYVVTLEEKISQSRRLTDLSFVTYDCIQDHSTQSPNKLWPFESKTSVSLSPILPRKVIFQITSQVPINLLQEAQILHVAYAISSDYQWICVGWTDNTGNHQASQVYSLKGVSSEIVFHAIMQHTRSVLKQEYTWRVVIACVGNSTQSERQIWSKLAAWNTAVHVVDICRTPVVDFYPFLSNTTTRSSSTFTSPVIGNPSSPNLSSSGFASVPRIESQRPDSPPAESTTTSSEQDGFLLDQKDESYALILPFSISLPSYSSHSLSHIGPPKTVLASALLLKRGDDSSGQSLPSLGIDLVENFYAPLTHDQVGSKDRSRNSWSTGIRTRSAEHIVKEVAVWYRALGVLGRLRRVNVCEDGIIPWHIGVVISGAKSLEGFW